MDAKRLEVEAAVQIVLAVGDAIRELGQVRSGHLYATLAGVFTLAQYEAVIDTLVRAGAVRREPGFLLVWCGSPRGWAEFDTSVN